jgi:hypothetical protein
MDRSYIGTGNVKWYNHSRKQFGIVIECMMAPKSCLVLISRTIENITFYGKRDFADVIKLESWEGEIALHYPDGYNVITKGPYKRKAGGQREERMLQNWL